MRPASAAAQVVSSEGVFPSPSCGPFSGPSIREAPLACVIPMSLERIAAEAAEKETADPAAGISGTDETLPPPPDSAAPRLTKRRNKKKKQDKNEVDDDQEGQLWPIPYIIEDGLRRVAPYHYTYKTWVKQRWRGRELLDVFESEFRDRPLEYYRQAMISGHVRVDNKQVAPEHVLKNGELVSHTIHRHEPPVTADPIAVLHEDGDMIVIVKPSGVPVHPAGRYNYNSVIEIMRAERGKGWTAYPCNRLDRLTSGIMFIAKHPAAAEVLSAQIAARTVRKEYIARVIGEFPDGEVVCNEPILQISPKLGLNRVRANGKHARTVFKKIAYYPPPPPPPSMTATTPPLPDTSTPPTASSETLSNLAPYSSPGAAEQPTAAYKQQRPWTGAKGYSILRCLPVTGRTHQLRVHLQHLGHPIQNDPIYANQRVWGARLGAGDADASANTDEDVISRLDRMGKQEVADAVAYHDEMVDEYYKQKAEKMSGELCEVCDTPLYTDPGSQELSLWLHSLRYEDAGGSWRYVSPLPEWALPPKGMAGPTSVGGLEELVEAVKEENPEIA
ncbi:tRNA pseudouridine32 synthase [Microdochium nivale]|nr:tRNA pseudouridine32 synthase [Microdochium nivale]